MAGDKNKGKELPKKRIAFIKKLIFSVIICLLILVVCEISARIIYRTIFHKGYYHREFVREYLEYSPIFDIKLIKDYKEQRNHHILKKDSDGTYKHQKHIFNISINSLGFRGKEITLDKPPRVYRIVAIGDSITFGYVNDDEKTYPFLLEKRLHKRGFSHVQVINAGIEGSTIRQAHLWFEHDIARLSPDMAVISLGWNDFRNCAQLGRRWRNDLLVDGFCYGKRFNNTMLHLTRYLSRKSAFFGGMRMLFSDFRPQHFGSPHHDSKMALANDEFFKNYEDEMRKIVADLKAREIEVRLILLSGLFQREYEDKRLRQIFENFPGYKHAYPDYFLARERLNVIIKRVGIDENAPVIDPNVRFEKEKEEEVFVDIVHLQDYGNELLAHSVSDAIIPELDAKKSKKTHP